MGIGVGFRGAGFRVQGSGVRFQVSGGTDFRRGKRLAFSWFWTVILVPEP
jgi:hypothetical protein